MLNVSHCFNNFEIKNKADDDTRFILTNKKGGYFCVSNNGKSRYDGMFFFKDDMYRIIESIIPINTGKVKEIKNNFYEIERKSDVVERFFMPHGYDSLVYETSEPVTAEIVLDFKKSYDQREWGRIYKVSQEKESVLIEFVKKTDSREDSSDEKEEYKLYFAVKVNGKFNTKEEWKKSYYDFDEKRNSFPFERYVFSPFNIRATRAVFSVSENKKDAINQAEFIFKNTEKLRKKQADHYEKFLNKKTPNDKEKKFAYLSALSSVDSLKVENKGIFAGLPWFFQFWARDEAISMMPLIKQSDIKTALNIIFRHLDSIQSDGGISIKNNNSRLESADALGWISKRANQFIKILNKKITAVMYSKNIQRMIESSINEVISHRIDGKLVLNKENETWMDSLKRDGFRIEIQAMQLYMYNFMYGLTKNSVYIKLEKELKDEVLKKFWNNNYLKDGADDYEIRPNIFIAYYFYPQLLSKNQWTKCFDNAIKSLWNQWGGFSTVDKESDFFIEEHTGEKNESYHNGDSWFWINNLAALCLYRLDKKRYKKYVDKILQASTKEILWKGAVGHHAELSSSKELRSEGCLAQAWSAAMYIELINEIHKF
ncbi:MAG: amylo-alpha-1,6-glucosidase [Candidatus Nanoarchaeia archaeon]|nr:amylo-alpha-1,6-glucosidase [Candidatus Nanoarchaeia archaeon]